MKERTAVILVDHGSTHQEANDLLLDVARLFEAVSGFEIVEPAHMELAEPTIAHAFDACVARGATRVVVHPYFLSPGRHSTSDIPRMTAAAARSHPGVRYAVTLPLGLDEKIAQVMLERIESCIDSPDENDERSVNAALSGTTAGAA
ncbi:MAG TPA: CbiX/SirB N-terminal domain-containing protein [Armatimonadota bacterium]|nr:CbiX/SirB N-terminal domain-containing protein [Armatimonadota bacterium]